ncbi:MAG TPA: hypothetical protein VI818_00485 [Candidatus Thermoplasmatota archaeon]|nr:hypothetical protein [Candidatus Thermoplasmatota archaeon]
MSHMAVLGGVEVPVTFSRDEAVGYMQEAGLIGAGGAGFPTYVKYQRGARVLLVNAAESEPGYYSDKLLLRDEPEALVDIFEWLKQTFSIETMVLAAEEVAKPYMADFEALAKRLHNFSIAYVAPEYKFGQERHLVEACFGMHIPPRDMPLNHEIIVNNNETMFNMYRAIFRNRPVMTKFLQVFGEVGLPKCYEVPVGTLAADLLRVYGVDPKDYAHCLLYDGGPRLAKKVLGPMGPEPLFAVAKNTNAFMVVHPDKEWTRREEYPEPGFKHNHIHVPWAPTKIVNVERDIHRVRVPARGRFWRSGQLMVKEGEHVARRQDLALPASSGLSVGIHASIDGVVKKITPDYIEIEQ